MSRRPLPTLSFAIALVVALAGCTTTTKDNFTNPPPGPPSTCAEVAALTGCDQGSRSFSCTSDRPDDGDTDLVCDEGVPGVGGATLYCCAPYGQWATRCVPDRHVPGCGAQSFGFGCSGLTTPDEADTSLVCSNALPADGGVSQYCCVSADQTSGACACASVDVDAGACGVHTTTCVGAAIGFTCAGGETPTTVNPLLACDAPDGGGDGATFCCETP